MKTELGSIPLPFQNTMFGLGGGIAHNSIDDTLLIANAMGGVIHEVRKNGMATGRVIPIPFDKEQQERFVTGMTFHAGGDGGRGSIYAVESQLGIIYEVTLGGELVRAFPDLADPDRYFGDGSAVQVTDVDLILEGGQIAGFYAVVQRSGGYAILRLDPDGKSTGVSISVSPGGELAGILRQPFPHPRSGQEIDAYIGVLGQGGSFVILQGGEPTLRDITSVQCVEDGRSATLSWERGQVYDRIEVLRRCEVLDVLPGDADSWQHTFESDGAHELSVRGTKGFASTTSGPCVAVIGAGQVLASVEIPERRMGGVASDGQGRPLVALDRPPRLVFFDLDLTRLESVELSPFFASVSDRLGGIARGKQPDTVYLYNKSQLTLGKLDFSGELLGNVPVQFPGRFDGMAFDPDGDGRDGSLWLADTAEDILYEVDLAGNILRQVDAGVQLSGVSLVAGQPGQLFAAGDPFPQAHGTAPRRRFFRLDLSTGAVVPGSVMHGEGIAEGDPGNSPLVHIEHQRTSRLFVLSGERIHEMRHETSPTPPLAFLTCGQFTRDDRVVLEFGDNPAYDSIEVFRDCERIATLDGPSTGYLDEDVEPGFHEYAVRGVRGALPGEFVRCSLQVGVGALLKRSEEVPGANLRIARDPDGGLFYAVSGINCDRQELHILDAESLLLVSSRSFRPGMIVTGITIRNESLYYMGRACNGSAFFLAEATLKGDLIEEIEIVPPQPASNTRQISDLAWDPGTDTFFYQERRSNTFVQMASDGRTLRTFPNPDPPIGFFVKDVGVAVSPERGTLFFTTAARSSLRQVTRAVEMRFDGTLTGYEIPLTSFREVHGIVLAAVDLLVASDHEVMRVKAFDRLPPLPPVPFLRGDSNGDSLLDISDAIHVLSYLFLGMAAPRCFDAADVNDDGKVNISDGIHVLNFLFLGRAAPPAPFPLPGLDPTPDTLRCEKE